MIRSLALVLFFSAPSLFAANALPWSDDLDAELRAAEGDGKPTVVLIRNAAEAGSLDARDWLRDDDTLKPLLEKFHRVALWHGDAALKPFPVAPKGGFLFLTPKRETIAVEDVPPLRAALKPLLARILEKPEPPEKATPGKSSDATKADPDTHASRADARLERTLKPLPDDLKAQFRELMAATKAAEKDAKAAQKARELVKVLLARPMTPDECQHSAGLLTYVVMELDFTDEKLALVEKIRKEAPVGRIAADAFLDLADEAFANGARDDAIKYWQAAEQAAGSGESPTMLRAAHAMRALAEGQPSVARKKWEEREVLDVVVIAPNNLAFAKAIARWTNKTFFPVLLKDDIYTPRFIAAFKPAQVVIAPWDTPVNELPREVIGDTIRRSWIDDHRIELPAPQQDGHVDEYVRAGLERLNITPTGVVFSDGSSGETIGGMALAAGRFEGFEFLSVPKMSQDKDARIAKTSDSLSKEAARTLARQVSDGLARWAISEKSGWASVTLAGAYPYRYSGDQDGYKYGNTYALDDLLGRDENGARIAVTGRLLGDAARSAYQAMCSLFLQPDSAFLFNTYGANPRSIWGSFRMDFAEAQWKDRMVVTHLKDSAASIETFRAQAFPWNRAQLLTINSSGGTTDWSVGGGGGTADDFPVGGPVAIHVTHSGSAGNPYDPDTLAGRAVWGGAFFYFGSVAEPFLSAFQPPRYYAPRIAAGAPFAAAFRQRAGQYFGHPWRLMIIGDPQFCLRKAPAKRVPFDPAKGPLLGANEKTLSPADYLASAPKWLAGDTAEALSLWQKTPPEDAALKYAARVYARQQVGHLMDKALAADNLAALQQHFPALLGTTPARSFVERWCGKLATLAEKKKDEAAFVTWLQKQAAEAAPESFRSVFATRLNQVKLVLLKRKEHWEESDKAEALQCFAGAVKTKADAKALATQLQELLDLCARKFPAANADAILNEAKALFPADSSDGKRVESALKELEKKRAGTK